MPVSRYRGQIHGLHTHTSTIANVLHVEAIIVEPPFFP